MPVSVIAGRALDRISRTGLPSDLRPIAEHKNSADALVRPPRRRRCSRGIRVCWRHGCASGLDRAEFNPRPSHHRRARGSHAARRCAPFAGQPRSMRRTGHERSPLRAILGHVEQPEAVLRRSPEDWYRP
jgi:hypothetical protein